MDLRIRRNRKVRGPAFHSNIDEVEIVTQLSLDRISRLEAICNVWNGPITAAILDEDRTIESESTNNMKSSLQLLQRIEDGVSLRSGFHSLRTILLTWVSNSTGDRSYPINILRNIALQNACCEFVFLLDVDCIPSSDLYESLVGTPERKLSMRNICLEYLGAIVVPCFDPVEKTSFDPFCRFSSQEVRSQANLPLPKFRQFALEEFERGHKATNYHQWLSHNEKSDGYHQYYQIQFEEGFEPFIIVARALTPLYCETLVGYGRNKILHVYHMSRLGISFWVIMDGCLVHIPHPITRDRIQLLGDSSSSGEVVSGRLDYIKGVYNTYRERASVYCTTWALLEANLPTCMDFSNFSNLSSPIVSHSYTRGTSIAAWPNEKYYRELLQLYFTPNTQNSNCLTCAVNDSIQNPNSEEFLANLCSFHLRYQAPSLTSIRSHGLDRLWNFLLMNGTRSSLWLVTHLSIDRLERLLAICRNWDGPIAAAIWIPSTYSRVQKRNSLRLLEESICSYDHLKFIVFENSKKLATIFSLDSHILSPNLYPFNALRGAALDIVKECEKSLFPESYNPEHIYVVNIDVDMRPPHLLSKMIFTPSEDNSSFIHKVLQACTDGNFVILPALELINYEVLSSDQDILERVLSTVDIDELRHCLREISDRIQPFHIQQYPQGHGPSQTSLWLQSALCEDPQSLVPINYEEGYEPYGILSLKTVDETGGFHRAFVGRHKDKVEFIMRLHMLGIEFKLWLHPAAFVFDWKPHAVLSSPNENKLHRIIMEGLYRRSRRQLFRYKEIPWDSSASSQMSRTVNDDSISASIPFRILKETYRSSASLGDQFWKSDGNIKVHSAQPIPSIILDPLEPGTFRIKQDESARISNGFGISIPLTVTIPLKVLSCLGISFLVQFPSTMDWTGGSLSGVRATSRELSSKSHLPFERSGEVDGRIRWNEYGTAHFQLSGIPPKTPGFHILMNRHFQFHKNVWHRIEVVFSLQGRIEASIDGVLIFAAKYLPSFSSLDGVRMSSFSYRSVGLQASHLLLSDIVISGNSEDIFQMLTNPKKSIESIQNIISTDLTVIFAPKEFHSLATRSLLDFLTNYSFVFAIVIVIAPPIPQFIVDDMKAIVALFPQSNCKFHYAENFQNPYEIRNLLATRITTKYTLHLNNDIFSVQGYSPWLVELIKYAEENSKYCAVMPFLLENNVTDSTRLHVWWKLCRIRQSKTLHSSPTLDAVFDNSVMKIPFETLRKNWKCHGTPPLHFLEDHCVLVRTDFFRYSPLFDPFSCYRREFFDIAWMIRSRGGDVGMALESVVVYQRLQPLQLSDLPYFLQRRQDSLCFGSQIYLNKKWNISYRYDRWHEKQRLESILQTKFNLDEVLRPTPTPQLSPELIELITCFFVAVGANRFRYNGGSLESIDEVGESLETFYPTISRVDWGNLPHAPHTLLFRQECVHCSFNLPVTPNYRDNLIHLLEVVEENELPDEPLFVANPFSGYCLFRFCCPNLVSSWSEHFEKNKTVDCISDLLSLIIEYRSPADQSLSFEAWLWVRTNLDVPTSLSISPESKSPEYELILSVVSIIGKYLGLEVIPSTSSTGTYSWQSFDLIRNIISMDDGTPTLGIAHIVQYSFHPHTLEELQGISTCLESLTINFCQSVAMKVLGQDLLVIQNQLLALIWNLVSWLQSYLPIQKSIPKPTSAKRCIAINGPGGLDRLVYQDLPNNCIATAGYNIPNIKSPYVLENMPANDVYASDHVIIRTSYFSINYADVTIRWGLYESALRYVGWPIVPGFDFSGVVTWAGPKSGFKEGDEVFGFTLFGAYSNRILVPARQIRLIPPGIPHDIAAAIPAVAGTAIHAVSVAGGWPSMRIFTKNKAVLVHSAAGGVGSMLLQICKLCGYSPIVAVVGSSHKVELCTSLGADVVIDKSKCLNGDIWPEVRKASPGGYIAVFDATGVDTLAESYNNLSQCGRLITYGFHSNLPKASHLLSPINWINMIAGMIKMPKFDAMALVVESRAVIGFNLSFFAEEHELIEEYMNQVVKWLTSGEIKVAEVTTYPMSEIQKAHELIQSGQSRGKIVVKCD